MQVSQLCVCGCVCIDVCVCVYVAVTNDAGCCSFRSQNEGISWRLTSDQGIAYPSPTHRNPSSKPARPNLQASR